jgi:hypothetical protein
MFLKFVQIALIVTLFSFLTACQKEDQSKKPKKTSITESSLYKISSSAAILKLNIETLQKINCIFAEKDKVRGIQKDTPSFIQDIFEEKQNLCNFYTSVIKEVKPIFESIEKNEIIPKNLFTLTVISYSFDKENDLKRIYEEEVIGLFNSYKSCEAMKTQAQSLNIPNKGCKKWDEKEF